jgi:ZIP family zinc transporter
MLEGGAFMSAGIVGYLAALAGFLPGAALAVVSRPRGHLWTALRLIAACALIAVICFGIMPRVFASGVILAAAALLAGTLTAMWFDVKSQQTAKKSTVIFAVGIMLHGFPEGILLGDILLRSFAARGFFLAALAAHCLVESVAISSYMRRERHTLAAILIMPFALAAPVGLGAAMSGTILAVPVALTAPCLAFACGIMLFLACGELLPDEKVVLRPFTTNQ